jgi:hypothetical protein
MRCFVCDYVIILLDEALGSLWNKQWRIRSAYPLPVGERESLYPRVLIGFMTRMVHIACASGFLRIVGARAMRLG